MSELFKQTTANIQEKSNLIWSVADLLRDYVYPLLDAGARHRLRIYFAYYLGDGVRPPGARSRVCSCRDTDAGGRPVRVQWMRDC